MCLATNILAIYSIWYFHCTHMIGVYMIYLILTCSCFWGDFLPTYCVYIVFKKGKLLCIRGIKLRVMHVVDPISNNECTHVRQCSQKYVRKHNMNSKPYSYTKQLKNQKLEDETWDGCTWGARLCTCAYCPSFNNQPSASPKFARCGSLHKHKTFKELLQILIGNSQSQTKCAKPLWAPSNSTNYIQLSRDIYEVSSNGAHP